MPPPLNDCRCACFLLAVFAAGLLSAATAAEPRTLKGHTGWVGGVAFSPDGKTLVTASADTTVKLWDVATGKEIAALEAHSDAVTSISFSADGRTFATGSFDGTAKLWDAATRKVVHTFRRHRGAVLTVALSPEGRLATGGIDGRVLLWEVESGREWSECPGHKSWVNALAFRPGSSSFASVSSDNEVWVRDFLGSFWLILRPKVGEVRSVAFSPDRKYLAAGTRYGLVKVWDMTKMGDEVATLKGHAGDVWAVAFSADGKLLASGDGDWNRPGDIRLWDTTTWKERGKLTHTGEVLCLAFAPNKPLLAAGSWDKTVKLWDLSDR